MPESSIDKFLDYYEMSRVEFEGVLDKWANKELFDKVNGKWTPKFNIY